MKIERKKVLTERKVKPPKPAGLVPIIDQQGVDGMNLCPNRTTKNTSQEDQKMQLKLENTIQLLRWDRAAKQVDFCRPIETLEELILGEKLSFVSEAVNYSPIDYQKGHSPQIAFALMLTLISNGKSEGWDWVEGYSTTLRPDGKIWEHDWLQCEGWAFDGSCAFRSMGEKEKFPILVSDAQFYSEFFELKIKRRWNDGQIREWLFRQADQNKRLG